MSATLRNGRRAVCALAAGMLGIGGAIVSAATPASAVNTCGGFAVTIQGTTASETLTGTAGNDVIDSGGGNDVINGAGGDDTICAGTGNDTIDSGAGTDTVSFEKTAAVNASLASGTATGPGTDTLANVENLVGSPATDTLTGNAGSNTIVGGLGNDTMNGAGGVDTAAFTGTVAVHASLTTGTATGVGSDTLTGFENLTGSSGADTLTGDAGANTIVGGLGADTMNGAGGVDTAAFPGTVAVHASLTAGTATGLGSDTLAGFENLSGSSGADTLTGNASANTIDGGLGNDTMDGAGGVDTAAFSGATAVNANLTTGTATGLGSDTLANFENLSGSSGADTLTGSAAANTIDGGLGSDTMNGAGGVDTAAFSGTTAVNANLATGKATGLGSDTLANFENLTGSSANDILTGNTANNTLNGAAGTDTCSAGAGSDHSIDCEVDNGSITPAGAVDAYSFTFAANQKLYLQSTAYAPTQGDLVWSLTGPSGTVFGFEFANADVDTFTVGTAGLYTLTVEGNEPGDTGTHSFRMTTVVDQTGPITLGTAKTVTISQRGQRALYTFTGALNQRVSLNLAGSTFASGVLYFQRPDGSILTYVFFSTGSEFFDPTVLDVAGTWTLVVDPDGASTGTMSLLASAVTDQAAFLTLGTPKVVTISQPGQRARLVFSGALNQKISLKLSGSTIDSGNVTLVRPDGSTFDTYFFNTGDQFFDPVALDVGGAWSFYVDPDFDDTGSITVLASSVVDQTGTITLGTAKTVTIGQAGQRAIYTFSGALNQRISLKFSGSTIDGGEVSLVRPDGSTFATYFFDTSDEFIDPAALDVVGTWSLVVDPDLDATGSITVLASSVVDQTGAITLGTTKAVTITQPGQNAVFTFSGALNQRISLNLSGSTIDSGAVSFVRPDGSTFATYFFDTTDQFIDPTVLDVVGTWSLVVDPDAADTGSLGLLASSVVDQSGSITLGTAKAVTITQAGQRAVYTFSGALNQRISLNLSGSTIANGEITFVRPDGSTFATYFFDTTDQFIDPTVLDVVGTWKIVVDPDGNDTGSISLLASAVVDQTGTITLGTAKVVTISQPGQRAIYTFTGTLNQKISLNLSGSTIDGGELTLVRPNGSLYQEDFFGTGDQFDEPTTLDVAGTWKLIVDPDLDATGSITVLASSVVDQTGAITLGTAKAATITQPGQRAIYTFTGALNQRITINLSGSTIDSGTLYFVRPDGSTFALYGFGTGALFIDPTVLDVAGAWKLIVDPDGADTGSVTVLAKAVVDQTGAITLGTAKAVTISQAGQRATYTFHGTNGQALAINITGSTIADSLLFFYRPDGGEYTAFEFGTGNTGNGISLDTTGTWTVEVDPTGADTGSLNLKLS